MKCKFCGGPTKLVLRPETPHYGEIRCQDRQCGRHNKWVPKPENKDKRRDKNTTWRSTWESKGFKCGLCGATAEEYPNSGQWELDHIIQLSDGGEDVFENTMMLCVFCHTIKNTEQKRRKAINRVKEGTMCQTKSDSIPW